MKKSYFRHGLALLACAVLVAGCGAQRAAVTAGAPDSSIDDDSETRRALGGPSGEASSIWDIFRGSNQEQIVSVNKYLWSASLEVLSFLPVESIDPFTGVITTGYGTPPGSGKAYRATILIDDPALDARSLNVSLQTRNGPASASAVRAVENAILSRARQLRIADDKL